MGDQPQSEIGAAIVAEAQQLPDQRIGEWRQPQAESEPSEIERTFSEDEVASILEQTVAGHTVAARNQFAQEALEAGTELQAQQEYVDALEQGLDPETVYGYEEEDPARNAVHTTLDAAFGQVRPEQFASMVEKARELDEDAVAEWAQAKGQELQAELAITEIQRRQAYDETVEGYKERYHEVVEEAAAKHGVPIEELVPVLQEAYAAGALQDEDSLRLFSEGAALSAHAEGDALGANIVRAGVLREAPVSDKRAWEQDGFAKLHSFPKHTVNYDEVAKRAHLQAASKAERQQAVKDEIMGAAAEIDPGNARAVNEERGWQNRPALEGRKLAEERQRGFRR